MGVPLQFWDAKESRYYNLYRKYIESTGSVIQTDLKLNLKGANGLSVPYVGYIEIDIECMGTLLRDRGVLIVKDVVDEVTRRRKEQVPGILGMNIIRECRDILFQEFGRGYQVSCAEISENSKLRNVFQTCDRDANSDTFGFAKLSARKPVKVPGKTVIVIDATGPPVPSEYSALVEPLKNNGHLPEGIVVVHTYVTVKKGHFQVRIANLGETDYWIAPRTRIGLISKADEIVNEETQKVKFCRVGTTEEIFIQDDIALSAHSEHVQGVPNVKFDIPVDITGLDVDSETRRKIEKLFYDYQDVFSKSDLDTGYTETVKHRINLTDNEPVNLPYRRIPPNQFQEVKQHIRELLQRDIIRESTSAYASPLVIVRKKNNEIRLCVDYRRLNKKTVRDAFPLPRVEESFDCLNGSKYFSTMDLTAGYNQVAVEESDKHKTAFTSPFGL